MTLITELILLVMQLWEERKDKIGAALRNYGCLTNIFQS
jgi:hypothetical protein